MTPAAILATLALLTGTRYGEVVPDSLQVAAGLMMLLFPAVLAYVVIVHKAMGVGMAIRQGLQYALARRVVVFIQMTMGIVVLFGLLARARRMVLAFACTSTVLLILGWTLNPSLDADPVGLINRGLALFVIWAIAGMAYHYLNAQHELEAALRHLAESDPLTQILNRVGIMTELSRRFAEFQRYGSVFSVLMVDVDHFKQVNDRLGHLAGDQVLRRVAGIVRSALREVDSVGRYGGEEFLVVLPGTRLDSAVNTAERIRVAIEQIPIRVDREQVRVTVSIGAMSAEPGGPDTVDQLIGGADRAMYEAKHSGRNRVIPPPKPPALRAAPPLIAPSPTAPGVPDKGPAARVVL